MTHLAITSEVILDKQKPRASTQIFDSIKRSIRVASLSNFITLSTYLMVFTLKSLIIGSFKLPNGVLVLCMLCKFHSFYVRLCSPHTDACKRLHVQKLSKGYNIISNGRCTVLSLGGRLRNACFTSQPCCYSLPLSSSSPLKVIQLLLNKFHQYILQVYLLIVIVSIIVSTQISAAELQFYMAWMAIIKTISYHPPSIGHCILYWHPFLWSAQPVKSGLNRCLSYQHVLLVKPCIHHCPFSRCALPVRYNIPHYPIFRCAFLVEPA